MDKLTVKIMSYSCKMADITEEGVSCKNQKEILLNITFGSHFLFSWLAIPYIPCLQLHAENVHNCGIQ